MSQKFAAYDASGNITGFYDTDASPVPQGVTALAISDDEWMAALSTPVYTVVSGTLVAPAAPTTAQLLAEAKAAQIAVLTGSCQSAIVGGFMSSELGADHTYPSQVTDQINLMGAAQAAGSAPDGWTISYWCADAGGSWAFVSHTAAQIRQVFDDGVAARVSLSAKLADLTAQVNAAKTITVVQAIVWG